MEGGGFDTLHSLAIHVLIDSCISVVEKSAECYALQARYFHNPRRID